MASHYNSRPLPAEVLIDGGKSKLIRRRENVSEMWTSELELLKQ
jgi:diaminopimelate decarboxylase